VARVAGRPADIEITRRQCIGASGVVGLTATGQLGRRGANTEWLRRTGDETMEIMRVGSRPSGKGPAEYFTGSVRIDPLFQAPDPARVRGASVTFEPGARTAWHTHPLGQTLIVTAGCGWIQREGGPVEEIRPGDVVWFSPGEKHWHGATATTGMTHIALQEALNGKVVDWMEKVSDDQYRR
jgi:quercetin dioxygenase-like cupin family protein